jgi:uncharacterized protein (TIGR02452 family)
MEKNIRVKSAEETLEIVEKGFYPTGEGLVNITEDVNNSIHHSILISPSDFVNISTQVSKRLTDLNHATNITLKSCTVLEATQQWSEQGLKAACLNFASAKNPGGGFLNGAQAQEESLARASCLYSTQIKNKEMYEFNKSHSTYLYSDYMIYSPDVVFFKNDEDQLLDKAYKVSVLTSPAVNVGAIKNNRVSELEKVEETMRSRIDKVLSVFVHYGYENIILGAWGCGVFQNDPEKIAGWFNEVLQPGTKYGAAFKQILFAVYDRSKEQKVMNPFKKILRHENENII